MVNAKTIEFRLHSGIVLRGGVAGPEGAPTVLLLHGGGQTRESWRTTADQLGDRGWRAIYLDLRGHGESDWSVDGDYRSRTVGQDIIQVVEQLETAPAIVGASMGGLAALSAIKLSEDALCAALVLVDVAPKVDPEGARRIVDFMLANPDGFSDMDEVLAAVAKYNPNRKYTKNGLLKNVRLNDRGRYIWHWDPKLLSGEKSADVDQRYFEAAAKLVAKLHIPTLLVRGKLSDLLTRSGAEQFLELVPHAQFEDVEGAGHMVVGDRNDHFSNTLISFLSTAHSPGKQKES